MSITVYIVASGIYIGILFLIAYLTEKQSIRGKSWVANPYIYALSLAVYCTAWTFFGSAGKAVKSGIGFLPIYLGPTIFAPLWLIVLRKMILISKNQRITSIADFISSRYGKSSSLGVLVSLITIIGIVPYISLQLKAIADCFDILASNITAAQNPIFYYSTAFYVALALALFTILFGTRKLEPNERHEGLVTAIAFESIIKIAAFLIVGIHVTFFVYHGFGDLMTKAALNERAMKVIDSSISSSEWFWLMILSFCAVILLPRQFHVAVVENSNPDFVAKAMWLFPLYLLIINIFVLPVTLAGIMQFTDSIKPDSYVLQLPLSFGQNLITLIVFIGGFSAATSMVIVETTALSIMMSNHLIMPPLLTSLARRDNQETDFSKWIIGVRRISIVLIIMMAFAYLRLIATNQELVSIGLVSFAAVAQFAPSVFAGMFWRGATAKGTTAGLIVGFVFWAITLPVPTLAEYHIIDNKILTNGYFNQWWLKPYALFGLEDYDHISHAAFWSLLFNMGTFLIVSHLTTPSRAELTQADYFINIYKYVRFGSEPDLVAREAKMDDIVFLLKRFLGEERTVQMLDAYEKENKIQLNKYTNANTDFINYAEMLLTGALGGSSARILFSTVVKEAPISLDEMLEVLGQTQEMVASNKILAQKSEELEVLTHRLQDANQQLKYLDKLKADFITTVTHELRTPMTSIKAFSKILLDNRDLPRDKQDKFLNIVVSETERITRLINQVLDIEKIQSNIIDWKSERLRFDTIVARSYDIMKPYFDELKINAYCNVILPDKKSVFVMGDGDRITQSLINIMSNAAKFANPENGRVDIYLTESHGKISCHISDNGSGILPKHEQFIFERFTQLDNPELGKPKGSGLGLYITKHIIEFHKGVIKVENNKTGGACFTIELPEVA